jgi:hypothetical protein
MLQTRPTSQYAGTGWCLIDYDYHATRPQFTYRAGNMAATRLQFDAYRRFLHMPYWAAEIQFWCWSQADFKLVELNADTGFTSDVVREHFPQAWPQSIEVPNDVRIREYRLPNNPTGLWGQGTYQNYVANAAVQMTIAGRWAGVFRIAATPSDYPFGKSLEIANGGAAATVRILAIGHHNQTWATGGIP